MDSGTDSPIAAIIFLIAAIPLSALGVAWCIGIARLLYLNHDIAFVQYRPYDQDTRFTFKYAAIYSVFISLIGLIGGPIGYGFVFLFVFLFLIGILPLVRWFYPNWQPPHERRKLRKSAEQQEAAKQELQRENEVRAQQQAAEAEREAKALINKKELQNDKQKRRTNARFTCELFFNLHKTELAARFNKSDLDEFMTDYMSDTQPPELVEMYAVQLKQTMEKHLELAGARQQPRTIEQLAKWYITEKERIGNLEIDEELKESHSIQLDMRYTELSQEILESITP